MKHYVYIIYILLLLLHTTHNIGQLQIQQSSVAFNGHSRYLVSGGLDCVINIWDIKSRTVKRTYKVSLVQLLLLNLSWKPLKLEFSRIFLSFSSALNPPPLRIWTTKPKDKYHHNHRSSRCVVESFKSWLPVSASYGVQRLLLNLSIVKVK